MSNLPRVEYLIECTSDTLGTLELKELDLASQCERRARLEMGQAIAHRGAAEVCRFLIEHKDELVDLAKLVADGKQRLLRFPAA